MRRTQLYLDDSMWNALRAEARSSGATISELVRQALREKYLGNLSVRREAMEAIIGIRKGRREFANTEAAIRSLRRGSRLDRLAPPG